MTNEEALDLVLIEMDGGATVRNKRVAENALKGAIGWLNRMGNYEWNRQEQSMTLATGVSGRYSLKSLLPQYTIRRVDNQLWFTDKTGSIDLVGRDEFKMLKAGQTTTGKPVYGTLHSITQILEVYPLPDQAYTVYIMLNVLITRIDEVPPDFEDVVIDKARLAAVKAGSAAWNAWKENVDSAKEQIRRYVTLLRSRPGYIKPDPFGLGKTGQQRRRRTDRTGLL